MQKRRDISQLTNPTKLGAMLRSVRREGDEVVLEEQGKAVAAIIPIDRYNRIEQARSSVMDFADKASGALSNVPDDKIAIDIATALEEVRSSKP